MILIVAPQNDVHALAVKRAAESTLGIEAYIVDASEFPASIRMTLQPPHWEIVAQDGRRIKSEHIAGLWWRRPGLHRISDTILDREAKRFAQNESTHAFDCLALSSEYLVVNPLAAEIAASRKGVQLSVAAQAGMKVPRTYISNDPELVRSFRADPARRMVFKTLTSPSSSFAETRRIDEIEDAQIDFLVHGPSIFQDEIQKEADIRVTIIGSEVFVVRVENKHPEAKNFPDWRLDVAATCYVDELPDNVTSMLLRVMKGLNLKYGAIDLIRSVEGEYFFIEVNPSGQFLFAEIDTEIPISMALAAYLAGSNKETASDGTTVT